jgi:glucose-6-phosphate isomerase
MSTSPTHEALLQHAQIMKNESLTNLLQNESHCNANILTLSPHITFDYSRQHFSQETLGLLLEHAKAQELEKKIQAMANGELINNTEQRAVLHMALRENPHNDITIPRINIDDNIDTSRPSRNDFKFKFENQLTGELVQPVLDQIETFSQNVRQGEYCTPLGKKFNTFVIVGIGGSYLGTQFVAEAMRYDKLNGGYEASKENTIRFIANVDPMDFHRAVDGIDYQTTMVIIISKTFTTAETMKNAKLAQDWLLSQYKQSHPDLSQIDIISKHFIACSTAVDKATAFGINEKNIFPFWNWVGGRYSVTSCVGILPLSLYFGYPLTKQFLAGCCDMDKHFLTAKLSQNLPVLLGLLGLWNSQYLLRESRCIIPYNEHLASFVTHIQQVDMESNGKRVDIDGNVIPHPCGEIDFGTPGTNSQHSYFQLLHQGGRVVPIDFIGFLKSQCFGLQGDNSAELITSHDELMCNFFAQPDALAFGTDGNGNPHKLMPGNKPSSILLFSELNFYTIGLLLSLYEHRTAVQGFMWNLNSFDQFGVELGKVLANNVRDFMVDEKNKQQPQQQPKAKFVGNTERLLKLYLDKKM